MANAAIPTALPKGAVQDALNGYFTDEGSFKRRGALVFDSADNAHSLYGEYGGVDNQLVRFSSDGSYAALQQLNSSSGWTYATYGGKTLVSDNTRIYDVSGTPFGTEPAGFFQASAAAGGGGLAAGTYTVGYAYVRDGEEGALSYLSTVELAVEGAISVTILAGTTATQARVYRTNTDGDVLYAAELLDLPAVSVSVGLAQLGRVCELHGTTAMPAGRIRGWRGRLLSAVGTTVYYSEALRPAIRKVTNFVRFPKHVTFMEPVAGGVFVGTSERMYFLDGEDPAKWVLNVVDDTPPMGGNGATVPASALDQELAGGTIDDSVIWLTKAGFVLGLPNGSVRRPQAENVVVDMAASGNLYFLDGYVVALQN
jgi:hypothetical protein